MCFACMRCVPSPSIKIKQTNLITSPHIRKKKEIMKQVIMKDFSDSLLKDPF